MNKKVLILTTAAAAAIVTSIVWISIMCRQKSKEQKKMAVVADAGYETAYDVHYPMKTRRRKIK